MKKIKMFLCFVLSVLLFAHAAQAEEIKQVIAALPDEELIELCSVAMVEAYSRGISPQVLADKIAQEYLKRQSEPTPAPDAEKRPMSMGTLDTVRDALLNETTSETTLSYDYRATAKPTFVPLVQLADDDVVYISRTGERYHTTPVCSGMTTAHAVTLAQAVDSNHTPCRDCAYWMPETER